jgi:hypothetical protein
MYVIFCSSLNMHILCPKFGYCVKHEKNLAYILCFKCKYYTISFSFSFLKYFLSQCLQKQRWRYSIQWTNHVVMELGWQWTQFCITFMVRLGPIRTETKSLQFWYNFYYQLYFIYVKVLICGSCKDLPLHHFSFGLLKSTKNYNAYIINIQYNWVNAIPTHSIVITHYIHQQNNIFIIFVNVLILHYFHRKSHSLVMNWTH